MSQVKSNSIEEYYIVRIKSEFSSAQEDPLKCYIGFTEPNVMDLSKVCRVSALNAIAHYKKQTMQDTLDEYYNIWFDVIFPLGLSVSSTKDVFELCSMQITHHL